jgi:hypothetical protein
MSFVLDLAFDMMRGEPVFMAQRVDTWIVPGLDGPGAQLLGLGDGEFQLSTIVYKNNLSDANILIDAARELQGQVVDLVDDWGDVYANILVKRVDTRRAKSPVRKDGSNKIRVQIFWDMETVA